MAVAAPGDAQEAAVSSAHTSEEGEDEHASLQAALSHLPVSTLLNGHAKGYGCPHGPTRSTSPHAGRRRLTVAERVGGLGGLSAPPQPPPSLGGEPQRGPRGLTPHGMACERGSADEPWKSWPEGSGSGLRVHVGKSRTRPQRHFPEVSIERVSISINSGGLDHGIAETTPSSPKNWDLILQGKN